MGRKRSYYQTNTPLRKGRGRSSPWSSHSLALGHEHSVTIHHPKAGTRQFPPLDPHSSQHPPQRVARRWHEATRVCQIPEKPEGLQHNRCADESQVQKAIIFHQQKHTFLSQITPISNSKENNPRSEGGRGFSADTIQRFCRIRRFKRTNVKDYFAIIQAIFSPHCSRTIRVFKCEQKDLFITIIIKRNIKSMNLFACSIKLALLLSSGASCHINHTQFVYLSTISLLFSPSLICKALSFHLSSKHNQIQTTQC